MGTFYNDEYRYSLAHYGVPGMRWKRHKYTGASSKDYDYDDSTPGRGDPQNRFKPTMDRSRNSINAIANEYVHRQTGNIGRVRPNNKRSEDRTETGADVAARNRMNAMKDVDNGNGPGQVTTRRWDGVSVPRLHGNRGYENGSYIMERHARAIESVIPAGEQGEAVRPHIEVTRRGTPTARERIRRRRRSEEEYANRQNPNIPHKGHGRSYPSDRFASEPQKGSKSRRHKSPESKPNGDRDRAAYYQREGVRHNYSVADARARVTRMARELEAKNKNVRAAMNAGGRSRAADAANTAGEQRKRAIEAQNRVSRTYELYVNKKEKKHGKKLN